MAIRLLCGAAGAWLLARPDPPGPGRRAGAPEPGGGDVSVVIPARDEERSLPFVLSSLAAQDLPAGEVIVVDDHSSDATARLARAAGAKVIASAALPDGWTGKTWACHQGAQAAKGAVLAFVDADVRLSPDALRRLVAELNHHGGLVSVQPFHLTERPYERLSAVANVVSLMGSGAFSGPPRRQAALAFGACVVIGGADYRRLGGHAHPQVRGLVTEDIGLARRCRHLGVPVRVLAGRDVLAFRMYPGGIGQLAEGWTKGLAYGARHAPPHAAALAGMWVAGGVLCASDGLRALAGWLRRQPGWGAEALSYGAWAAETGWLVSRVGRFGAATAAAFPLPLAAFVALFARSVGQRVRGRPPRWRGRLAPRPEGAGHGRRGGPEGSERPAFTSL